LSPGRNPLEIPLKLPISLVDTASRAVRVATEKRMQRILPRADFAGRRRSPERIAGIAFAVLVPAAFVYAFVSGLAQNLVHSIPALLEVRVAPPQEETPPPPPPPPMPTVVEPAMPTVRAPVIRIAPAEPARNTITVRQGPPEPAPTNVAPVAPVAPAPPSTSATAVAGTHTTPPYPLIARRLGESGTVRLKIELADTGAVEAVSVILSSGHQSLDETAVSWVKSHWRWRPAMRAGKPVASTTIADIVFDLRNS
jgi:protein TonB